AGLHVPLSGELGAFGGRAVAKEAGVAECAPQGRTGEALEGRAARREAPQLALGGLAERSLELLPGCTPGTFYSGVGCGLLHDIPREQSGQLRALAARLV